jgi:hypothetical protein
MRFWRTQKHLQAWLPLRRAIAKAVCWASDCRRSKGADQRSALESGSILLKLLDYFGPVDLRQNGGVADRHQPRVDGINQERLPRPRQ